MPCKVRPRILFILRHVSEVNRVVTPTPEHYHWPLIGEVLAMFQLTDTQQVTVTAAFVDKKGNPAQVDGVPVWLVDNDSVLALAPAADGKSCVVSAVGPLGTAKVSMKADADLGAGVVEIIGVLDIEVTGGQATTVTLTPGTATEQP